MEAKVAELISTDDYVLVEKIQNLSDVIMGILKQAYEQGKIQKVKAGSLMVK